MWQVISDKHCGGVTICISSFFIQQHRSNSIRNTLLHPVTTSILITDGADEAWPRLPKMTAPSAGAPPAPLTAAALLLNFRGSLTTKTQLYSVIITFLSYYKTVLLIFLSRLELKLWPSLDFRYPTVHKNLKHICKKTEILMWFM